MDAEIIAKLLAAASITFCTLLSRRLHILASTGGVMSCVTYLASSFSDTLANAWRAMYWAYSISSPIAANCAHTCMSVKLSDGDFERPSTVQTIFTSNFKFICCVSIKCLSTSKIYVSLTTFSAKGFPVCTMFANRKKRRFRSWMSSQLSVIICLVIPLRFERIELVPRSKSSFRYSSLVTFP